MNDFVNPAIFGPNVWSMIDTLIAPLPEIIDNNMSQSIQQFYISLKTLLPCNSCLTSYNVFLNEFDTDINNIENFKKRSNLILFNYTLRTKVNNKLGKYYVINLNYYTFKLNLYKCTPTNGYDVLMSQIKECSFIPDKYLNKCMEYVNKNKNLIKKYENNFTITLIQKCKMFILNIKETDFNENNKMFQHWINRNKKSYKYQSLLYDYQTKKNCDINNLFNEQPEIISNLLYWGGFPFSSYEIERIDFLKNV
jgi:hypothetical protein